MDFYEKVIAQCREKGVSRSKMADDIGISRSTPKDWENGKATPRYDTIKKLADYFGVPVGYFSTEGAEASFNTVNGNNNIIGNGNTIGSHLSEQEKALLDLFEKMDVISQAKLLAFAAELVK